MSRATNHLRTLMDKLDRLPPEKIKEVEDFVEFLGQTESAEEKAFMRAVVQGLGDIEAGRSASLAEAKKRLGIS